MSYLTDSPSEIRSRLIEAAGLGRRICEDHCYRLNTLAEEMMEDPALRPICTWDAQAPRLLWQGRGIDPERPGWTTIRPSSKWDTYSKIQLTRHCKPWEAHRVVETEERLQGIRTCLRLLIRTSRDLRKTERQIWEAIAQAKEGPINEATSDDLAWAQAKLREKNP